ncbi:N-acetylneuraminate lyase [bioreactor metagenome]|uniref:N-acetylneuraminate lyase n=1 Tax=bioreactor metagenome TaxID=1076179 RepID=A0A644XJI0_9ZZZZ
MAIKPITGGVLVPACSPCDTQDRFLETEFAVLLEQALKKPLDGAYLCGGTGDGMKMRLEERKAASEIGIALCHKQNKAALVQVGAFTMRDSLELAEHAAASGADGVSSVPLPGASHGQQMQYYRALAKAAGIPVILYYMPQPGVNFSLENVLETLTIPGVTGVKSSTNDFFFTQQLIAEKPAGCAVFNGKDEYLAPAVFHGADGGIGMWATVFPAAYAGIYHAAKAGDYTRAFDLQKTLNALCVIVMRKGLLQSFACILHELGMHDRVFRAPAPQYDAAFAKDFFAKARPLVEKLISVS